MSTTLTEYMNRAATTAIYSHAHALPYLALGLCEEAGEYADAQNALELGDVLWYWLMLCKELGMNPDVLAERPAGERIGDNHCHYLMIATSKVAQRVKKHLRDGAKIEAGIVAGVYRELRRCAAWHETTIDAIAERLFAKLADRAQRGVLRGDGDVR